MFFCTGRFLSFAWANFHHLSPIRDNHSRNTARLVSLSVQFLVEFSFCTGKLFSFALAKLHHLSPIRDNHSSNTARLVSLECTISKVSVHWRSFRNRSVGMSKHSKMNKKRNTKRSPRRPKLWLALLTFFEYSQLPLMFYVFIEEVAIVVPLFSFFSSFLVCTSRWRRALNFWIVI